MERKKLIIVLMVSVAMHVAAADQPFKKIWQKICYYMHFSAVERIDPAQLVEVNIENQDDAADSFLDAPVAKKHMNIKALNSED